MLDLAFVNDLQAAVPAAGSITFSSGAYGYPPDEFKYPPSHWVPYARAAYMKTVAGAPIHVQQDLTGETDEKTRTYLGAS